MPAYITWLMLYSKTEYLEEQRLKEAQLMMNFYNAFRHLYFVFSVIFFSSFYLHTDVNYFCAKKKRYYY